MPRPLRVALIGHSTRSDNLGVGALTVSEIEILRLIGARLDREIEIEIVDRQTRRTPYVAGPDIRLRDLHRRTLLDPRGYLSWVRRADLVIDIGGGDSFSDIYGAPRMRRILLTRAMVHLAGRPLVMAPQTIGPFAGRAFGRLALASMRRCALVATRDALSTAAARAMGFEGTIVEASDVALRLPYTPASRPPGARPRVGINVSGLLMAGGYTGKNEFLLRLDYPALIRGMIGAFLAHPDGCEVHLVPHVLAERAEWARRAEDDLAEIEALASQFPGVVVAPRFATPSEAKSYIAGMDFFTGARMHACIAAFSSGVPVVPLAYSRKFEGLFGSLGFGHVLDCTALDADTVLRRTLDGYADRAAIGRDVAAALVRGRDRLSAYETALEALLARCGSVSAATADRA